MSKVFSTNVGSAPPTAQPQVTAADVNAKFTAVATATSAIDNDNVRSEGVDIRQLSTTSPIINRAVYTYNKWDDGTTNSFTIGTGGGGSIKTNMGGRAAVRLVYALAGGNSRLWFGNSTPLVLNQGDMLRLHYSFNLHTIELDSVAANFPIDASVDRQAIIFFPVYHPTPTTTPNTMANAFVFPNRAEWWGSDHVTPVSIPQTDPPSASTNPNERLLDDGIAVHDLAAEDIVVGESCKPMRRLHGCLNYVHESASPLTIYEISIASTPVMKFQHFVAPGYDTRCWIVNATDLTPYYPLTLKMERANLSAIVLKKGAR